MRLRAVKRWMFARHANPWSAWTRWASTPLVLLPVWTRRWDQAGLVGGWMLLNPVIFPVPRDDRAWASRAMLGEERWIEQRPRDAAMVVNAAATVAGVAAMAAARARRPVPAGVATAAQMALIMAYWKLMADQYDRRDTTPEEPTVS